MTNIKNPKCFKQKLETKSFMFQTKQLFQTIKLAVVSPKMFQIQANNVVLSLHAAVWDETPERQVLNLSSQEILLQMIEAPSRKIEKTYGQDSRWRIEVQILSTHNILCLTYHIVRLYNLPKKGWDS